MAEVSKSLEIMSKITIFTKYTKYIPSKKRRETWEELCYRNRDMHIKKYPHLHIEILNLYNNFVIPKKVLPSMRSMQFAGKPIEVSPNRIYNCCYLPIDDYRCFSEVMFLLLGGTGVGYSVQTNHVEQLPPVRKPLKSRRFLVADSIEGWADAVKALMSAYMQDRSLPDFDFRDIREKGAPLITSGGKAPGAEPLKTCLHNISMILERKKDGEKLSTLEVHDVICHIADAVLAGGIRRAACISLFDIDDTDMLTAKFGNWWESNPQRGRANNSAVILRHKVTHAKFMDLWGKIKASGSGEPGFYFTNNADWGTNPSLRKGTKVMTTGGIYPIEELQDKEFEVKNLHGEISKAKCWLSGKGKKLYKLNLVGGHEYYATAEHEWPIWNGSEYAKVKTPDIQDNSLLPIIQENSLFDGKLGTYEDGFAIGWQLGDGALHKRKDNGKLQHSFIVAPKDNEYGISDRLSIYLANLQCNATFRDNKGVLELSTVNKKLDANLSKFGASHKSNGLPSRIWNECSENFRKGIVDALFSSDGCVDKNDKRIIFSSSHKKLINDMSELLGFYGIKTIKKERLTKAFDSEFIGYQLLIQDSASIIHFKNTFKLSVGYKQDIINSYKFRNTTHKKQIKILNIEETDLYEDVWDISVQDSTHCFQIAHCITGNCCEIALKPYEFCNLTEINFSDVQSQEDLNDRARAAAFLGTLQAGYTDFHYLRDIWKRTTEKEALIGVSGTGIASGEVLQYNLTEAANIVKAENARIADLIGINRAARTTAIKPSGTTSMVLGTSSGIHAWHDPYFIRRMRLGKNEAIYKYLATNHPELIEDEFFKPDTQAVIHVPIKAPATGIFRDESPIDLLERIKRFSIEWVNAGHRKGENTHNVSATISIKDGEWEHVAQWMWDNREFYNGLSILPHSDHTYVQAPFETIDSQKYAEMEKHLNDIDLTKIIEDRDNTNLSGEAACAGGKCEL